ncbi:MAG: magnesium chelatase [Candidatus Eisenbacteria bacterium]
MHTEIRTFGALKESGYRTRGVRDEVRENLIRAMREGRTLFPDIVGYDKTVLPQLVNALLSRHDILLLGLRGQAKTRIARSLVLFLDEWIPAVGGSSLNEDPFHPVTGPTKKMIDEIGDETPIHWIHRDQRYQEKLATPDVSMADLIGDIDPIRASRDRLDLSDERVIHFGIIPRTNRGLFCLNELPDLQPRIQVGMLNILEERDLQIRGFPLRLKLDILMLFTANPEDYTNRGNIITPLKDRIPSQVITHYPESVEEGIRITRQEARVERSLEIRIPPVFREIIEEIAIQARESEHVDQTSGVSARLPISAIETLVSNVERRAIQTGDTSTVPRLSDLFSLLPAITGKLELVYEGEQEGATIVATRLIGRAVKSVFRKYFPPVHEERRGTPGMKEPLYERIQAWFNAGNTIEITDHRPSGEERAALEAVPGLEELADKYLPAMSDDERPAAMELVLEGLHQHSVLSREGMYGSARYGDMLSRMMQDL